MPKCVVFLAVDVGALQLATWRRLRCLPGRAPKGDEAGVALGWGLRAPKGVRPDVCWAGGVKKGVDGAEAGAEAALPNTELAAGEAGVPKVSPLPNGDPAGDDPAGWEVPSPRDPKVDELAVGVLGEAGALLATLPPNTPDCAAPVCRPPNTLPDCPTDGAGLEEPKTPVGWELV